MISAIILLLDRALGLADDEEKKFNHRRTKYYYVRNPNVVKIVIILSVLIEIRRKMRFALFL